ncbi:MAG: hypothetical protein IPP30_10680 [Flavobacterium sp.]|nr:hypothetical protein [Flavobacterium sp.]
MGGGSVRTTPATTDILIVDGAGTSPGGSMIISHNVAGQTIGQLLVTSSTTLSLQSDTTTTRTTTISGGGGDDLVVEAGSTLQLINAANACAIAFSGTANTGLIAGTYNAAGSTSNLITTTGGTGTLVTVTGSVNNNIVGSSGCMTGSAATLAFAAGSNYLHGSFTTSNGLIPLATWDTTSTVTITGGTTSTAITNNNQSFGNFVYNSTTSTGTMSVWTTSTTAVIKGDLTISATGSGAALFRACTSGLVTVNGNLNINGTSVFQCGNGTSSSNGVRVLGNTTIAALARLDLNSATLQQRGLTFTNNGTLTGTASASALLFFSPTNAAQTFTGTGTVLTNIGTLGCENTGGLTISTTNPVTLLRVNLFNGTITGSNLITFGTGAALNTTVQIGYAGNVLAGGSFDVAPTFNLGTGTHGLIYAAELAARTTGLEIPPSRILGALTSTNANGVVVAGGNLSTGTLTFGTGTGNITTDASNVLTVTGTTVGSVVRTSATAYVNGPLALTLPASLLTGTTYTFPIGKSALNTFALVNPTTNAGGTVTVQAEAFDGATGGTPGLNISAISSTKYWAASITGGAANFTDSLIQLGDVPTGRDAIAASATQTGAYDLQGGVTVTTTGTTMTTTAPANTTLPGFFLMGNKAAADITNVQISPAGNQCTNVARTVTADVTPGGGAVTGVVINYTVNGVAQTAITMTNTTSNGFPLMDSWSGVIPTVTPANATVAWSITATDANTLVKTVSGTSYNDEPLFTIPATATASVTQICGSGSSVLNATFTASASATIGTGVTLTSATAQPTAFCNRWPSYRMQTVYTAAELSSAGLSAGNITSMAFNITTPGDGLSNSGFEVKIGTTALSVLSGATFQSTTGYTTVFPSATYTHTASGQQVIPFSTPFVWDGVSNIIVDMVHNGADATNNSITFFTATAGNTVAFTATDASNAPSYSPNRLNVVFAGSTSAPIDSILWSNGDTTVSTTVSPAVTTGYSAVITSGGCTKTTNTVTVNVTATPSTPVQVSFDPTCGEGIPLVSVSDPNAFTTPLFKWYAADGTTLLQSNVATTYLASISETTTFKVSVVDPTSGCESGQLTVAAVVVAPTAIDPIANQTVCVNTAFSVTAAASNDPVYVYTWTAVPAVGSGVETPLTGASQTITPTVAGTYTYTVSAVGGGCSTTTTFTATVNAYPVLNSASASPAAVCTDGISTLTATVPGALIFTASTGATLDPMTGAATVLGSSNDDTVTAAAVNIGFSFTFNGVAYTQYNASPDGWMSLGSGTASNSFSNDMALATNLPKLAPMWDDLATGTTGNVTAVTTGTAPNRILKVQWFVTSPRATGGAANSTFQAWLYEGSNTIEYRYGSVGNSASASGGYTIGATNFSSITFSSNTASTVTADNANAVAPVSGTMYTYTLPVPGNITWAPLDDLYTDALATTAYTGTNAAVVYSKPTVTRIYTATLSENGCDTVSSPITVTQNGELVADPTGPTAICLGSPTIPAGPITYTNGEVTTSYFSSNPAVATIDQATGVLTPLTAGTTNITAQNINLTTGCTSNAANALAVTVSAPIAITTNPVSQTVLEYDGITPTTTTFTAAASGSVASYQWQVSPTGASGTYVDIAALDPLYSGQQTNTLSIANATFAVYSGLYYLCVVTPVGPCTPALETTGALLTVSNLTTTDPTFTTPICGTGNHTFTTVSTPPTGVSYEWYYATVPSLNDAQAISGDFGGLTFPLGVTGASLEVNGLSVTENGWYFFVVANDGASFVQTNAAQVVVNPAQTVGPTPVADQTICFNAVNSSTFTVDSAGGTGFQWQYSATNNGIDWVNVADATPAGATYLTPTGATLTVNSTAVLAVGTYYYRCLVAGPSGCPAIASNVATLTVTTPTINVSADVSTICGTGTSILTATGAATYAWTASASLSGPLNLDFVTANPTATTTYTVTGTDGAGCIATGTITITVNPAITATATATPNVVCTGTDSQLLATYTPVATAAPSTYSFVGSTGTYTPITGGNATTAAGDDGTQFPISIGFPFTYNGTAFTDFGLTTNGHIRLGAGAASFTNGIGTNANILAPMWDDNNLSAGNITYKLQGPPGSQVLTVQWENVSIGGGGSTGNSVNNYQVQLFEGTNVVKFNYGALSSANGLSASIGISGASGNFLSVTPGSPASASAVSSVTANNSISSVANIPTGTSYTFTPPVLPTITYSWSPSTFLSDPNIANPIAQAVTADTTYTLTVTSSTGCSDTETVTVSVASAIAITGQPQPATFCQGQTASLSIGATGASLIYQWRLNGVDLFGEINSSITIPAATPANSGNYDVVINDVCGGTPVTSDVAVLTIVPTPTVNAPAAWPSTVCAGTTTTAVPLTGSVGAIFNITGGTAIGLVDQTGVTEIPSFTGIAGTASISITPVVGTCTGTAISYSITIQALPTTVTVSPATATICSSDVNAILLTGAGGAVAPVPYCTPTVGSTGETDDNITNFTFAGINNTTGDGPGDYNTYLSPSGAVTAGVATPFSITPNSAFGQQFRVWVDMDQNGIFEASESVFATTASSTVTVSGNITIPTTAFNGTTRMRVGDKFSSAILATEACGHTGFGEWEDYTVVISGGTPVPSNDYVWSSTGGGLFTDLAGTIPYTGAPSATVYAKPSATVTITATYTNAAGCVASGNSVVTFETATTWYADADGDTFGNLAVSQLACTQPVGYVANSTDCDDTNIAIYQFATFYVDADLDTYGSTATASVCSGLTTPVGYSTTNDDCDDTNALFNPTNPCPPTNSIVNLTLFVQGYYLGGSTMNSVKLNQWDGVTPATAPAGTEVEDLTIELHETTAPYAALHTTTATLNTDGTLSASFAGAPSGSFYVVVRGSNLVQTWSATAQTVGNTPLSYDFSSSSSQALGDNMIEVESGVWAFYSGDMNQDLVVDGTDSDVLVDDIANSNFGALATDLNGDGSVDGSDSDIFFPNLENSVFANILE